MSARGDHQADAVPIRSNHERPGGNPAEGLLEVERSLSRRFSGLCGADPGFSRLHWQISAAHGVPPAEEHLYSTARFERIGELGLQRHGVKVAELGDGITDFAGSVARRARGDSALSRRAGLEDDRYSLGGRRLCLSAYRNRLGEHGGRGENEPVAAKDHAVGAAELLSNAVLRG